MKKLASVDRSKVREWLWTFILMNIGTLCLAAGVYFFKSPNHFATGGVSGISVVLGEVLPHMTPGAIQLLLNAALLLAPSFGARVRERFGWPLYAIIPNTRRFCIFSKDYFEAGEEICH